MTDYVQGRNHVFKVGVEFLGLWYYYLLQKKIRQVYPGWCSRLHNHTLISKSYAKSWGSVQILGVWTLPNPSGCDHDYV